MNVDEIADMLIALISNDPVQRVEGLNATAQFLHTLQRPSIRFLDNEDKGVDVPMETTHDHN